MCKTKLNEIRSRFWMVVVVVIIIVAGPNGGHSLLVSQRNHACDFLNSINITDGKMNATDKSITHNGILFAQNQYSIFDYRLIDGHERVPVPKHKRGCPCLMKPCIRLYCMPGFDSKLERGCNYRTHFKNYTMNIIDKRNHNQSVNIVEYFSYVVDRPCKVLYDQKPGTWQLKHTGQVTYDSNFIKSHDKYTIVLSYNETAKKPIMKLLLCEVMPETNVRFYILPYVMCLSVVCILATIVVYVILPGLLNTHGKSLLGYLCSLFIGYTLLAVVQINGERYVQPLICSIAGYLIYFGFLSSFLWLNIISIDLWLNFRTMMHARKKSHRKRIILYAVYAWGTACLATIFAIFADSSKMPEHMKPGIGVESCFLKENRISQGIYFFIPLALIISVNAIFFILTALKIREVQQCVKNITERDDSHRHQSSLTAEKDKIICYSYSLFLRLFIIMGVAWLTESISWAFAPDSKYFIVTDVINSTQGFLIFVLFVLKPEVIRRIKNRCCESFHTTQANGRCTTNAQSSTRTTSIN